MKKSVLIICLAIISTVLITPICNALVPIRSIKLENSLFVNAGKSIVLKATVIPSNATNKKLMFTTANKNIALVDKNGKITGVKDGKTIITATSTSDKSVQAKCAVTVSKNISFVDYKETESGIIMKIPKGWAVSREKGTINIKNPSNPYTKLAFIFIASVTNKINAVGFADIFIKKQKAEFKDYKYSVRISKNKDFVEFSISYTKSGKKIKGIYNVFLNKGNGLFSGFETLEAQFLSQRDILNYILSTLKMPSGLIASPASSKTDPNMSVKLYYKSDRGTSISVPEGWSITAFGSPGNLLAVDADGNSGYIGQSVSIFPPALSAYANGNPVSSYLSPSEFLSDVYMPALGNSNTKIEKEADASILLQGAQGAEAEVVLLTCDNQNGIRLKTLILAITLRPSIVTGQWAALVYGFWTPEKDFDSRFTLMKRIADSYKPNEEEIRRQTAENFKNYQQGIKKLSQSLTDQLNESYKTSGQSGTNQGISSEERLYQKWNDYAAGEERLYSAVEDKVYTLPSGYDKYNNPKYQYEELSPINNDQWNKEVDRSYLPGGWNY